MYTKTTKNKITGEKIKAKLGNNWEKIKYGTKNLQKNHKGGYLAVVMNKYYCIYSIHCKTILFHSNAHFSSIDNNILCAFRTT